MQRFRASLTRGVSIHIVTWLGQAFFPELSACFPSDVFASIENPIKAPGGVAFTVSLC